MSRWVPVVLVLLALATSWLMWGDGLLASRPATPPLTPLERRFGPGYDRKLVASLERPLPTPLRVRGTFADAVDAVRDTAAPMNLFVNWRAVESAGISRNTPVQLELPAGSTVDQALLATLDAAVASGGATGKLGFHLEDVVVTVSTADDLSKSTLTRVYDVRDLVGGGGKNRGPAQVFPETKLTQQLTNAVDPASWRPRGKVGNLRWLQGQLIVTQTAVNQHDVQRFLEQRRWHDAAWTAGYRTAALLGAAVLLGVVQRLLVNRLRRRAAARGNRCPACGYDLRATPDRCPECGTAAGASNETPGAPPAHAPLPSGAHSNS